MKFKRVKVNVTASHICDGERQEPFGCPIALALVTATGLSGWSVAGSPFDSDLIWYASRLDREEVLPKKAARFARAFDNSEPVEPFSFTIRVPVGE